MPETKPTAIIIAIREDIPVDAWVLVRCPSCGKVITEAQPGSVLKVECKKCKAQAVVKVA